uniref:Uncharacterized protein n=1 Tax=Arundo donax TaxID=35708 RepID=A0A0A9E8S9_ARUDO
MLVGFLCRKGFVFRFVSKDVFAAVGRDASEPTPELIIFVWAHLDVSEIDIVVFEEALEFLEVLFGRAVMTAVGPNSLQNSIFNNQSSGSRCGPSSEEAGMLKCALLLLSNIQILGCA